MAFHNVSLLTSLVILLSLFYTPVASGLVLHRRAGADTTSCTTYSRIANLTTISTNTTYRAAFLRSAPMGTFMAASTLDKDASQLPVLQMDAQLNEQCGNLTTIAIDSAATNFTEGTVLGFKIRADVGILPGNPVGLITMAFVPSFLAVVYSQL
ncbi:hypothetical protein F5884DRAFT_858149 [Xylogone sp. PMI_703]|nr:hypothetical protein F5884DRAFT_858149 [Xylogone sp. PMI_703]